MTPPFRSFRSDSIALEGCRVLVTGGTGSFGQSFIAMLLQRHKPKTAIVFSRDELKQYEMQHDPRFADNPALRFFIGDVRDCDRLEMAMRNVDIVVHAAALKHVTAAEYNPIECIMTNVHGAENVVKAAIRTGVKKVIALSTDKAANPINLYGTSKLAADKIFVAANNLSGVGGPRFSVVRYGNVLGSRGSVVPFFRKLIKAGAKSLPITDSRMTRFWITLEQGVDFVGSSLSAMRGGEIFVPKIPSMRVIDLPKAMAPELPTHQVGIRPGEKLHETLVTEDEARNAVELNDRLVVIPTIRFWSEAEFTLPGSKPVPEGFRYTSDGNNEWLALDDLRRLLLQDAGI